MYLPAGYESSDSEDYYYDGFTTSKPKIQPKKIEKSPMEQMKDRLLLNLRNNELHAIKEELDCGAVKGFDIDEYLDGRWSLLYHACFLGLPDIVQYLIEERGANTNVTENCETPLMVACYSDAKSDQVLKVVKLLIKESTIISSSNLTGVTALMFASSHGHVEVVKYLLSLNDSFDAIDNEGQNALFYAIDGKNLEIAKILIAAGIDLSVVNKFGYTANHYALDENQLEIAELFPPEEVKYETPSTFVSYNRFEDLIPGINGEM